MGAVKQSPRSLLRNVVLHVVAFAVILFGLEAKLALYKQAPELGMAALKLSTEKNSSKVVSAIGEIKPVKEPLEFGVFALQLLTQSEGALTALPVHSARISFIASDKLLHRGV